MRRWGFRAEPPIGEVTGDSSRRGLVDGSVLSSLWSFAGRLCGDWLGSGVPVCSLVDSLVDNIGQWCWSTAVAVGSVWRRTVFVFFLAEHSPCNLRASASSLFRRNRGDSRSVEIKGGP